MWLTAAAAGDPRAFANLYDKHVTSVYRYALQMLRSVPDAEDISQEVFVLAWTKRAKIRVVDQSVLPWLLVTTRNLTLNKIKQSTREARNTSLDDGAVHALPFESGADAVVLSRQLEVAISDAIDDLSPADQTLYYLCIAEGLSYQKAADSLGTSHSVVRNRLSRLRRTLRLKLVTQQEGLS